MNFIILFEDDATLGPEVRRKHLPDHLDFLKQHADVISAAGPLAEIDGVPAGGIWLVSADDAEAADALVRKDPFWLTGLRQSVRILPWTKVFEDGGVLI